MSLQGLDCSHSEVGRIFLLTAQNHESRKSRLWMPAPCHGRRNVYRISGRQMDAEVIK